MRLASEKFKYLSTAKTFLPSEAVPAFEVLEKTLFPREVEECYILRSSLQNEASKGQLLSGKSLSISGIDSWQKLKSAWDEIQKQKDLNEVILQKEISWETHATLFWEKEFFFAELKGNGPNRFSYWTPLGQSLNEEMKILKDLVFALKPLLRKENLWLMEIGIKDGKAYLFQLHPIELEVVTQIFNSDMVANIVSSRMRFAKSHGLWNLLKTEWKAREFRKTLHQEFKPSLIFMNWEYLFHYFRLYCMMKNTQPSAQKFAEFLALSYQNKWLSKLVKKHLELAQFFRKNESFDPMNTGFESKGPIFIGKGIIRGVVGKDILVCNEISLDSIYQKQQPQAILTREIGLLSHPVLASVENGVGLVLGLETLPLSGERIFLDFENKIFRVK